MSYLGLALLVLFPADSADARRFAKVFYDKKIITDWICYACDLFLTLICLIRQTGFSDLD